FPLLIDFKGKYNHNEQENQILARKTYRFLTLCFSLAQTCSLGFASIGQLIAPPAFSSELQFSQFSNDTQ
ncbi:MAG: hypothetical protein J6X31_01870, partial [Bacteroidales bacterium]|nr:hypothetical protein [Bacteroidales bacterium]